MSLMSETTTKKREIKCPQCGQLTLFEPENPFRPFCSERCRLIDLGAWASETYKIPVKSTDNDAANFDEGDDEMAKDDD